MSYSPQYGLWSRDNLSTASGATYGNPEEYEIRGGVAKLLPTIFNSGTFAFNAPWDPVTGWDVVNSVDNIAIVEEDFTIYTGLDSSFGHVGNVYNTAFYTSGDSSCFIYQLTGDTSNLTLELDTRTLVSEGLSTGYYDEDYAYHGVLIQETGKYAFVEMHPEGLKVKGVSGAVLPGNYSDVLRKIRIVKSGNDIAMMSYYDDNIVYVNDAMQNFDANGAIPGGQSEYIAFGSIPWTGAFQYEGNAGTGNFIDWDSAEQVPVFSGQTLWDNISIATGQAVTKLPSSYIPEYPQGKKELYTDAWLPGDNLTKYHGAFVDVVGTTGGVTNVVPEYLLPYTDSLTGTWTQIPTDEVTALVIPEGPDSTYFIDLSDVRVFPKPFQNQIRFRLEAISSIGQCPMVDTITVAAVGGLHNGIVKPNWKLSSMPKELYFTPDKQNHEDSIPPVHPQDVVYFHNEEELNSISTGSYLSPAINVTQPSGFVSGDSFIGAPDTLGLVSVDDGPYGKAWRNFNYTTGYNGEWTTNATKTVDLSGVYKGELLTVYSPYPTTIDSTSGSNIIYDIYDYEGFDGSVKKAQRVRISNYNEDVGANSVVWAGIYMPEVSIPNESYNQFGVIEGVIHIPRGPGVTIAMHESGTSSKINLKGENYRTPKKFSCAMEYNRDHITNPNIDTSVSFGVYPRTSSRPFTKNELNSNYQAWSDKLEAEETDEFILYDLTGYMCDHSAVLFSGYDGTVRRTNFGIDESPELYTYYRNEDPSFGSINELNEILSTGGYDTYHAPDRNSLLFEGWFRPYGLTDRGARERELIRATDDSGNGLYLSLNDEGYLTYEMSVAYSDSTTGGLGTGYSEYAIITGDSQDHSIIWGEWNHIGISMEQAAFGDGTYPSSLPNVPHSPSDREILHGMRTSKVYLTINDKITDSKDIAGDPYVDLIYTHSSIAGGWPPRTVYTSPFPRAARFHTEGDLTVVLGEKFLCDMDHVRFSIRDRSDVITDVFTYGGKYTAGIFQHDAALKPALPSRTGTSHWEVTHSYPFDYGIEGYQLFDWGFAPNHAIYRGQSSLTGSSELAYYNTSPDFFTERTEGILNRSALRIGPGSTIEIPWSSADEKIFNGSASVDYQGAFLTGDPAHPDLSNYFRLNDVVSTEQSSNSNLRMGTRVKLNVLPTGNGIMDIMTLDEVPDAYGLHQVFMGVNSDGYQVVGTRLNYANELGPFTGTQMELDTWYHIGVDAAIRENDILSGNQPFMKAYFNGSEVVNEELSVSVGNALSWTGCVPFGYGGFLDTDRNKSVYRIGGDIPRDDTYYDWTFRYGDFTVQDSFIGYAIETGIKDDSVFSWSTVADYVQTGQGEALVVNGEVLNIISGTNLVGKSTYPATEYSDAGEQYLLFTVNGGNDYEGLLQRGMALSSPTLFRNASSYYALYENDQNASVIGSTDSPIQIGNSVPLEGVNLAMVNITPWQLDSSISSFDMSDSNYSNITSKVNGDLFPGFETGEYSALASNASDSNKIRVSSFSVSRHDEDTTELAYFAHLIGGDLKGLYVPKTESHLDASADSLVWSENLTKIKNAISLTDSNGAELSFDVFPYDIRPSPYKPTIDLEISTGNFYGEKGLDEDLTLENNIYSVVLLASRRTIGDSIFINYPSIDYTNGNININDSEVYNPVPLMREIPAAGTSPDLYSNIESGYYSVDYGVTESVYDVRVWHGTYNNLSGDNQFAL